MHHPSVARQGGPGHPRYAGQDWHRAVLAWTKVQILRMEYGYRGKRPGEFDTPYARALEHVARELGFGKRDPREALKKFLDRALKSAPPEVRAALPDHKELDAVFAKRQTSLKQNSKPGRHATLLFVPGDGPVTFKRPDGTTRVTGVAIEIRGDRRKGAHRHPTE